MRAAIVAVIALALLASGTALARTSDKVHSAIPEELKNNPPRGTYWDEERGVFVLDPPLRIEPPQSMLLNGDEDMIFFDDAFLYTIVSNDYGANSALTKFPMPEDPCEGGAWVLTSVLLACYNRELVGGEAPDPLDLIVFSHGSNCTNFDDNPNGDELVLELARLHDEPAPFSGGLGPILKWQQFDFEYPVAITTDEFWIVWKHIAQNTEDPASYYGVAGYGEGLDPDDYYRFFEDYNTCPTILLGWGPWAMRAVGHCSETPVREGKIDIKPTSCPNPINPIDLGVISVAILGTDELDVRDVDPSTVVLRGVPPVRYAYDDVGTPYGGDLCGCHTLGADGYEDLVFKFDSREVYATLGNVADNEEIIVVVTWGLYDGTLMQGADCFIVRLLNNEEANAGGVGNDSYVGGDAVKHGQSPQLAFVDNGGPRAFGLAQNAPNPFRGVTTVNFSLGSMQRATLTVHDAVGRKVATLVDGELAAGHYSVEWRTNSPAGIYFCYLEAGDSRAATRMVQVR